MHLTLKWKKRRWLSLYTHQLSQHRLYADYEYLKTYQFFPHVAKREQAKIYWFYVNSMSMYVDCTITILNKWNKRQVLKAISPCIFICFASRQIQLGLPSPFRISLVIGKWYWFIKRAYSTEMWSWGLRHQGAYPSVVRLCATLFDYPLTQVYSEQKIHFEHSVLIKFFHFSGRFCLLWSAIVEIFQRIYIKLLETL